MKITGHWIDWLKKNQDMIAVIIVIVFVTVMAGFNVLVKLEERTYDALIRIKPDTTEREDVVMVAIDDESIAELGEFPWPRNIVADTIIRMRELGAASVTFDIEYLQPSAQGINGTARAEIPDRFQETESSVEDTIGEIVVAVGYGMLSPDELMEMGEYIVEETVEPISNLGVWVEGNLFRNNDEYFAQALHFFGNSWVTFNMTDIGIEPTDEQMQYVKDNLLLKNLVDEKGYIASETADYATEYEYSMMCTPAMDILLRQSSGAGFTNVCLDKDGERRRIKLVFPYEDMYAPQLVLAPMLKILNPETIERTKYTFAMRNCHVLGEDEPRDIVIPLDDNGNMLVNWIPGSFSESFKNIPVWCFNALDETEAAVVSTLKELCSQRLRTADGYPLTLITATEYLLQEYDQITQFKEYLLADLETENTREDPYYDQYFELRKQFFEDCELLLDPAIAEEVYDGLKIMFSEQDLPTAESYYQRLFSVFESNLRAYQEDFATMKEKLDGAFCIVGHTASASTDLGTTPFAKNYPNIGTHANVYNTIMTGEFITPMPWYFGIIIASVFMIIATGLGRKFKNAGANITLIVTNVVLLLLLALPMALWSVYIQTFAPMTISILGSIVLVIQRFMASEKDKSFLRNTFSTYVSGDVVDEIMKNPAMLKLGGDVFNCTAIFTDIRSFSTISERVDAAFLVQILNEYLTLLSDVILEKRGTIDKYEGDAIIGFWGAPMPVEHNAYHACVAALRMKAAEANFNRQMIEDGRIFLKGVPMIGPNGEDKVLNRIVLPLATRIGLNSGEMVVGNMGTDNKKNYTMMGTNVNLAARLEGVNKVYQTWILVSEYTWNAANEGECRDRLLARRLDRVRVIGIKDPVQLINVVGVKEECTKEQLESVRIFNEAIDIYLTRDFVKAREMFQQAFNLWPEQVYISIADDEAKVWNNEMRDYSPCLVYIGRCDKFIAEGCPDDWDGIVNMTSK